MKLIYTALTKTKGDTDGTALVAAMKGASWTSPRGPVLIDPETRDVVQNVYIREVTVPNVKDPVKEAKR
jgi:branched-chain amino acid transport system substrate-binding protein